MISIIGAAVALSLQIEAGGAFLAKPEDDVYVEYKLGGTQLHLAAPAFGGALRLDGERFVGSLGWRSLGNQHEYAPVIIYDGIYESYALHGGPKPTPKQLAEGTAWTSVGSESQIYASLGYKLRFSDLIVVPTVGVATNRTRWHYEVVGDGVHNRLHYNHTSDNQQSPARLFFGVDVEQGAWGAGIYFLDTSPLHTQDNEFDGQGNSGTYLRITYRIGVRK
jgi:hypothetical protein